MSGVYTFSGTLNVELNYQSKSTSNYIQDALVANEGNGIFHYDAVQYLGELRNNDPVTSSLNDELRNAEYALYGYNAGQLVGLGLQSGNLLPALVGSLGAVGSQYLGFAGPIPTAIYNGIKQWGQEGCVPCNTFVNSVGAGLPASSAGGLEANTVGFEYGVTHPTAISGLPDAVPASFASEGQTSNSPAQPALSIDLGPSGSLPAELFNLNVSSGSGVFVDPPATAGFVFSVEGANLKEFEIPDIAGLQNISQFTITYSGKSFDLTGGSWYSLYSLFGIDPDTIMISGLLGTLVPDSPIFGFRFDASGDIVLGSVGGSFSPAIPEILHLGHDTTRLRWPWLR